MSSSGKTQHFDCCIRRFESCHPSHQKRVICLPDNHSFCAMCSATAERDVHFVCDVCFASDVRFARERGGTHLITFAACGKIITTGEARIITCPSGQSSLYAYHIKIPLLQKKCNREIFIFMMSFALYLSATHLYFQKEYPASVINITSKCFSLPACLFSSTFS